MARSTVKMGRPRCFCEEDALEAAMRVFWEKGYEGASLTDLTEAMGINRPSLYATFGDKEALFRRAMQRYAEGPAAYLNSALEETTARGVIEALLRGALKLLQTRPILVAASQSRQAWRAVSMPSQSRTR